MKLFKKILLGVVGLLIAFASFIQFAPIKTYDLPYPEVVISTDSATLARGEYLVYGPAHCYGCHSRKEDSLALANSEKVPFAGGRHFDTPMGKIYIPNITPDMETGIGKLTDGEIARAMRYAVRSNGHVMIPAMPFTHMSDSDLSAIISYLRAQPAVYNKVPENEYTFMGKALTRFLLKPFKQTEPIPNHVKVDSTIQYGAYLANSVANCKGCHTTFNMMKMEYDGIPYSGGMEMAEREHNFITPNLTPDPKTGHIYNWSEEQFVLRFQTGRIYKDSPMSWKAFSKMPEIELKAIYRYLRSLEPVENEFGPVISIKESDDLTVN